MNRLFTASAIAAILALSMSPAFAACVVETSSASIDNETPADATWADNESLSPLTGGEETVTQTRDTVTNVRGRCTV